MEAVALQSTLDSATVKEQKVDTHFPAASPFYVNPVPGFDNPVIPRKSACACGGGCPRCERKLRIQPKLALSQPGDVYEQEADRVADEVMRMPEPGVGASSSVRPDVQRLSEGGEELTRVSRAIAINAPTPETTIAEEENPQVNGSQVVSRKPSQGSTDEPDGLEEEAAFAIASKGSGRPLSEASRQFFEPRFGYDFSAVRIHDGAAAAHAAARLNARAFTYGSDVWLGPRESETDRSLVAHELVHTVQQRHSPGAAGTLRRYVRRNNVYLWDVFDAAGRDPAAVTDAQLRTTIEYEDYMRADLAWNFSYPVAIAAVRRSLDLFVSGVRGRGPNYIRAGDETRTAAHGISSIVLTELGFTGDHTISSVTGGLGGTRGAPIDSPDGSTPVWTIGGVTKLVAYTVGTPPTMFARLGVAPAVAAPVPNVQVKALVNNTIVGQASGLQIVGDAIERVPGSGLVRGIGGGAAIPGAAVGALDPEIRFETSTDGGRIWFASGSARLRMVFTAATPAPPGGLREDALEWGALAIGTAGPPADKLRWLVKTLVYYNPSVSMLPSFAGSDGVMTAFTTPQQCDTQAYLLRYLALSFGIPAEVVYFWYGAPGEAWHYHLRSWVGPTFQCDRPAEDSAVNHPHFTFHALTNIGGTLHDPSYDFPALPGILEHAPGATAQTGTRADFLAANDVPKPWTCPH
jgi:hypothetical protein